ncbi:MAG: peptidoglycan DD-metalloendopeptidase family protein [Leptospirales bacterium]
MQSALARILIPALAALTFIIAPHPFSGDIRAESAPVYQTVRSGETLSHIALRFRTTIPRIKKWNRLSSDTVRIGQKLKVGFRTVKKKKAGGKAGPTGKRRYYLVRPGDTLGHIARRHRTSVAALRKLNRMKAGQILRAGQRLVVGVRREGFAWKNTTPHTRVKIPYGYSVARAAKRSVHGVGFRVDLYARRFAQGHALYFEILPGNKKGQPFPENFKLRFADADVPLTKTSFGYNAIAAISAFSKPGRHPLVITTSAPPVETTAAPAKKQANGGAAKATRAYTFRIHIADTKYKSHTRRVYLGDYDKPRPPVDPEVARKRKQRAEKVRKLIGASTAKKTRVFKIRSANQFTNQLSHPRSLHKITSPYNTKRITVRYYRKNGKKHTEKPRSVYHHGLDLRGRWGDPIYAMADGTVVCARLMHYEGNFTMIDHGNGIFTGYMHQSKFHVREGQKVKAGQLIGKSGATGRARGAHLHLNLWIRGTPVEPLSLLSLPLRR